MRNFIGGLVAVITGSIVIVLLLEITQPVYPEPFNVIWLLLAGSSALQSTLIDPLTPLIFGLYLISWLIIGLLIGPFSKPGWNTVRSALWVGLIHALFSLTSKLLLTPEFWESTSRNFQLLSMFTTSLILSILALPSAIPAAMIVEKLGREAEKPIPPKIETVCECGAIFKSNPMICSECGKTLQHSTA